MSFNIACDQQYRVSYEELKAHSSYTDAWIAINGTVYDITDFIGRHPFGDTFRGHLGTECGGLFSSAHATTNVETLIRNQGFLRRNNIRVIGQLDVSGDTLHRNNTNPYLDRIVYCDTATDNFWLELKNSVAHYLKEIGERTHYTAAESTRRLLYHLGIYLVLSYCTWFYGSFVASFLLAVHMICALADVSHMATHSGFSLSRRLDFFAAHLFDLSGMSGLEWQITHQTHHNQPHSSIDHQTNTYDYLGVRIHKHMQRHNLHKFQFIYFWLVVSTYLFFKFFATTLWLWGNREFTRQRRELGMHFFAKAVLLVQILCCIYFNGAWMALGLFSVYAVTYSQTAFILLFNDHEETHAVLGEVEDISEYHGKLSWAEVQVRTSGNWYPTNWLLKFIEFHYGYFNYHIEHHLFPTFKPRLLKKISPIVKSVCEKYGIPYRSTSFFTVQASLLEHLKKMSQPAVT